MKKRNIFFIIAFITLFALPVYADSLESVRVIKFWDDTDDMIVERNSGEQLLIQHNYQCSTMSTEFPIQLLWTNDKITQAKVASNELCKVNHFGPYSSDLTITKRIYSPNAMTTEHLAEVNWQGKRYEIDYGAGCTYLRDYVGQTAFVYTPRAGLDGATLYLPKARGECEIASATFLENAKPASGITESPIKNLQYKAENNQVYFSWDQFPDNETWLVLIAYSKYQLNPDDYELSQMPNLRYTKASTYRMLQLINNQPYYFYLSASNADGEVAPWTEIPITPIQTAKRIINHVDPDPFEIEMTETDNTFHLVWPDKSVDSRKYMIMVYVDGKREIFKLIDGTQNYFDIEKRSEWSASRCRMTLRSGPHMPTGHKVCDSIFWREG